MTSLQLEQWIARKLRLRHIEIIAEVYDCRSIIKASQGLNLTQPAVTKALIEVETKLDLVLFERTNRGMIPTQYGEIFARHAKIMLAQMRHAAEELESFRMGYSGHVFVGTLLAASACLLPRAITLLKKERPDVALTVKENTYDVLLPSLLVGDLDLVLGRLPETGRESAFKYEEYYSEPTYLVARKNNPILKKKTAVTLKELSVQPWVIPVYETSLRRQLEGMFINAGVTFPQNIIESMSILTNRVLLRSSDCIGILPYHVALDNVKTKQLSIIPVKTKLPASPVGAITRTQGSLPPAAQAFLKYLLAVGKEINRELA